MKTIRSRVALAAVSILFAWPALLAGQGPEATATQAAAAVTAPQARSADRSLLENLHIDELLANNSLQHWVTLLGFILLAVAIGRVVAWFLNRIARRLENRHWHSQAEVFAGAASPASMAIFTLGLSIGLASITMGPMLQDLSKRILVLFYATATFWYAFNLVSVLEVAMQKFASRTETTLDDDLVPVIRKALRIFIVVIGALFILQNVFDRDIGAWLAGLGIAGLAVSLAAQDSLKNLFGSITILFDRPFTQGQRIKFHGFDGTVEEIGFRSTKVRTADGSLVTIPNSNIVNDPVDNWAVRQKIFRTFNITITYDTPVAKVHEAVEIVRRLLDSEEFGPSVHDPDPVRNADPPRVFFNEFNADSLNIKVWYWFRPGDWWAYCAFTEKFNLRLMEAFEKSGIEFAFPTRTVFLAGDPRRPLGAGVEKAVANVQP